VPLTSLLKTWRPYAVIIIIGCLLYAKTLSFDFVEYDDRRLIAENQSFLSNLSNLPKAFTQDIFNVSFHHSSKSYYRPILTVSLMLDATVGGAKLFIYHATNLIIHISTCCLVLLFFYKMGFGKSISFLFSAIFLVHPILTQAVAWVPGRNDSLLALFSIASIIFLIKFIEENRWLYYTMHLVFFALAIFTKETALGLIAICLLYYLLNKNPRLPLLSKIGTPAGWVAVILLWLTLRSVAVQNPDITALHVVKSVYTNLPGLLQYLGKILLPINLSVYPIMKDMPLVYGILGSVFVGTLIVLSKKNRNKIILLGVTWYVIFFLPSLVSATPGPTSLFHEHRAYLPMVGILMIIMEIDFIKDFDIGKTKHIIPGIIVTLLLATITFHYSNSMKNSFTFWSNAASTSPDSSVARLNLGYEYYKKGELNEAEAEFLKALELDSGQILAHNNLGMIYAVRKLFQKAEKEFKAELAINPGYENALYNLGMLNYDRKKYKEAVRYWEKALDVNPHNINANKCLARFFYEQGDLGRAAYHIKQLRKRGIRVDGF
jgi:Tfp pilus assembly protein PilF